MRLRAAGAGTRARHRGSLSEWPFPALGGGLQRLRRRAGRVVACEFPLACDAATRPSGDFPVSGIVTGSLPPLRRRVQA